MPRPPILAAWLLTILASPLLADKAPPAMEVPELDLDPDQPLPGIHIDHDADHVDIDAKVVLRDGDWLELLICSPNTREHESIFTSPARPSHVHLALLLLGLEPGEPMTWEQQEDGEFITTPPQGPELEIFIVTEDNGEVQHTPANEWILDQHAGQVMEENTWIFTGSVIEQWQDQDIYMADLNGTVISIVNFGDDLIARPTSLTNMTDDQQWNANTEQIPEEGTELTIRLKPVRNDAEPN